MVATYERSIVTFIDILGFADIVDHQSASAIDLMLEAVQRTAGAPDLLADGRERATQILSFSDSIIRARAYGAEREESTLLVELEEVALAQWLLAKEGIFIRGGMTAGDIAFSMNRAFGPAFVRAYRLETQFASVARIVLDPALLAELRSNRCLRRRGKTLRSEIKDVRQHLRQSDDGMWFIDYLWVIAEDSSASRCADLGRHKSMILEKGAGLQPSDKLVPKYSWLAPYHNEVAAALGAERDVLIRRSELPILGELLLPRRKLRIKSAQRLAPP